MSFFFRNKPRRSDRLRGRSGDDLMQHIKQQFNEDCETFFEPKTRPAKFDSFDRHAPFLKDDVWDKLGRRTLHSDLDDLDLKDHFSVPNWIDGIFHSPQRNHRRRDSAGSGYQAHPDEDARSQASGSSGASVASGASGVSSHDEAELSRSSRPAQKSKRQPIPQYGLRNTVDIGQHRHDMENNEKDARNQRSMSAPPENRQQFYQESEQQDQQHEPTHGQRFVSRVDITPQHNQKQQQQQQHPATPPQQQQQSNVRHIPIFVEGRDEPVISKNIDDGHFARQPSPPQHFSRQSPPPPQFQKRSPFGKTWANNRHQWPPQFSDTFYQPQTAFEQPSTQRFHEQRGFGPQGTHPRQQQHHPQRQQQAPRQQQQQMHAEQQAPHQQAPQQPQHVAKEQEPPKPKPLPKDPLERVALVQQEVDSLAAQVKEYTGNSRKDKQYIYLDEMLTRELIKLDDIETEGRENVRQARKNAIKTIQETISLLESKAPLADQQPAMEEQKEEQLEAANQQPEKELNQQPNNESMETNQTEEKAPNNPIPLPAAPSSASDNTAAENTPAEQNQNTKQNNTELKEETVNANNETSASNLTSPEAAPASQVQEQTEKQDNQQKNDDAQVVTQCEKMEKSGESQASGEVKSQAEETQQQPPAQPEQEAMEVEKQATPSPKLSKKAKKTQEKSNASQEAIPLPAPPQNALTK